MASSYPDDELDDDHVWTDDELDRDADAARAFWIVVIGALLFILFTLS